MIKYHIASGNPLLWMDTFEYERAARTISAEVDAKIKKPVFRWDVISGVIDMKTGKVVEEATGMPQQPIDFLREYNKDKEDKEAVMLVYDYHKFFGEIDVWRLLLNNIGQYKEEGKNFIVIAASNQIPTEALRYVTMVDFDLPTDDELLAKAKQLAADLEVEGVTDELLQEIVTYSRGLTEEELENALTLSMAKNGRFTKEFVAHQRQQMIKRQGTLELHDASFGFESVIGVDRLKQFAKGMVQSGNGKGVLLLGHPGGGKTMFAKALGKETGRPTVVLDTGKLMGSLVGETEKKTREAIQTIEAQGESIVFIDEFEKALSGSRDTVNSTSVRQGADILKWMSDRTGKSYVIATANDVSKLPPEFLRAERWDAIFFIDLPGHNETQQLLEFYCKQYGVEKQDVDVTEWTGAEIKSLCRIASSLGTTLEDAQKYVKPIKQVAAEKIEGLRKWAEGRCIWASADQEAKKAASEERVTKPGARKVNQVG